MSIYCARCALPLPPKAFQDNGFSRCVCGDLVHAWAFPAVFRGVAVGRNANARLESEASCFYHPMSRAEVPCARCGRLLCNVCDIPIGGEHCCAVCFETGAKSTVAKYATELVLQDSLNLLLAAGPLVLGLFLWWMIPITAPLALYRVFRHFNAPLGPVPRTRVRHVIAGILATLQLLSLGLLIAWGVTRAMTPTSSPTPAPGVTSEKDLGD